jgi:NTP pyrophosphatase (non-canonical NTP hydrolase)
MRDHAGHLHAHHGDASVEARLVKLAEEAGEAAKAIIGAASSS